MEEIKEEKNLFERLEAFKLTVHSGENAPKSDRSFLKYLEEGEREHDIGKIYIFIDGYECGPGLIGDMESRKVLCQAFQQSPERVLKILENKQNFIEIYALISMSSPEMIKYYVMNGNNPWTVFESLRQLLGRSDWSTYREEIANGAARLSDLDGELWKFWLNREEYQERWIACLDEVLGRLDKKGLEIYAESIRMNCPADRMLKITEAFRRIPDEREEFLMDNIAGILYRRWKEYLLEIKEKGTSTDSLILGGYANVILFSIYFLFGNTELWQEEFDRIVREFYEDMFRWYQSKTQLSAFYFAGLTQIYLFLLLGRKEMKIQQSEKLKAEISRIRELMIKRHELWGKEDKAFEALMELLETEDSQEMAENW